MKDSKSVLLLIVSFLLIIVSFTLLWTWRYELSGTTQDKPIVKPVSVAVTPAPQASNPGDSRDSLDKLYNATRINLEQLDSTWVRADSLQNNLDVRLTDFYKLRSEISGILKDTQNSRNIDLAQRKIAELQVRVDQLRGHNTDVEAENRRLYAILQQLTNQRRNDGASTPLQNVQTTPRVTTAAGRVLAATDMKLVALTTIGTKERETLEANQADRFFGSFAIRNTSDLSGDSEIFVIVVQPDNKILQASAWETGRLETKDGRKIYSCKLKFDFVRNEMKRLSFTINADKFLKGTYTMQLYSNGNLIGKTSKTLI